MNQNNRYRTDEYAKYWGDEDRAWPIGFESRDGVLFHNGKPVCDVFKVTGLHFKPSTSLYSFRHIALLVTVGKTVVAVPELDIMEDGNRLSIGAWNVACRLRGAGLRIEYSAEAPESIKACLHAFLSLGFWYVE